MGSRAVCYPVSTVRGSIGQILIQQGVIDATALSDALARQSGRHPVASELYALGYASERQLVMALSAQTGLVGDRARRVDDPARRPRARLARVGADLLGAGRLRGRRRRSWSRPRGRRTRSSRRASSASARGKTVELRIALDVTLARTIRVAFKRWKVGELFLSGPESQRPGVLPRDRPARWRRLRRASPRAARARRGSRAQHRERRRSAVGGADRRECVLDGDADRRLAGQHDHDPTGGGERWRRSGTQIIVAELDRGAEPAPNTGRTRTLVVDPDPPGRIHLVAELERLGYECQAASSGVAGSRPAVVPLLRHRVRRHRDAGARRLADVPRAQAQPAAPAHAA